MKRVSLYTYIELLLIATLLSACAQLGLAPATSFDQRWAYAMAVNTGIRSAAVQAQNDKAITANDHRQILAMNDSARAFLDDAEKLRKTDVTTAEGKLDLATSVLSGVKGFLEKRKVKVPVQVPK